MKATFLNPEENPRRRRRRVRRRHVRRRNAEPNPRRRRRRMRRRYNAAPNPSRRRSYRRRRNPTSNPELNFSRMGYATAGGAAVRLAMRKIAGKRVTESGERKLDTMHYVAALAVTYFGRDIAEAIGATPDESLAFEAGAAGVAGQFIIDQHLRDFSAGNLMPFDSPAPTGTDMAGVRGVAGLGSTQSNPMAYREYMRLAGIGQLPPGGVYVRGADGSVWWFPSSQARGARGMLAGMGSRGVGCGVGAGPRMRELPDHIAAGTVVRDTDTGERFMVSMDRGSKVLIPLRGRGVGASYSDYIGMVAR